MSLIWAEKYRPKTLNDYIFQDDFLREKVASYVEAQHIGHLLLSGPPGTGKTTLALLLMDLLNIDPMDRLIINASRENSVETVRTKITQFAGVAPFNSTFRVVLLDEGDYLSDEGQAAMRRLMEENSQAVRFIITCNYLSKLSDPIRSRCQQFQLNKLPIEVVVNKIVEVLSAENVQWTPDVVQEIVESTPSNDFRSVINELERCTINGVLVSPNASTGSSRHGNVAEIVTLITSGQELAASKLASTSLTDADYPGLYKAISQSLLSTTAFTPAWEAKIVVLAEYMYRNSTVADPALNFAACCIEMRSAK